MLTGTAAHALGAPRSFAVAGRDANAFGVALADVNGDRRLDVAVANNGMSDARGGLAGLHGDGAGGLGPAEGYEVPPTYPDAQTDEFGAGANDVAAGDLNGDGRPDLAVTHRISHARAAHGRTTVSVRRRGGRRRRTLRRSSRRAFTVRCRARPGRFVLRTRFTGTLAAAARWVPWEQRANRDLERELGQAAGAAPAAVA